MDLNLRGRGLGIIELEDFVRGLLEFIPSFVAPPNQLLEPNVAFYSLSCFVSVSGAGFSISTP